MDCSFKNVYHMLSIFHRYYIQEIHCKLYCFFDPYHLLNINYLTVRRVRLSDHLVIKNK